MGHVAVNVLRSLYKNILQIPRMKTETYSGMAFSFGLETAEEIRKSTSLSTFRKKT